MGFHHLVVGGHGALITYVVLVGLGVVTCFLGYRLFRVILGIWGFLAGVGIAVSLLQGVALNALLKILIAVAGGIVGGALVSVLYLLGVFLFGAGFGLLVATTIQDSLHLVAPTWPLLIGLGVLGGIAALILQRPLIKLFTAFGGAWILVTCFGALLLGCPLETFPAGCARSSPSAPAILVVWLVVGVLGYAAQSRMPPPPKERRRRKD
jgi:hypothetical protein